MNNSFSISKKDVVWSFVAKFFQMATGALTLPFILNKLTADEIALNYLMLTISSMVSLLDFGFSPQFARNFTYVNSGARQLLKEGVEVHDDEGIDYHLLSVLLVTARYVYRRLSFICLLIMLTLGTAYIYIVTDGFVTVNNSLTIWVLFSLSTFFTIYCSYYNSLLTGSGKIAEANKATILSKLIYLLLCVCLLFLGFGLFAVVISSFAAPTVQRFYSHTVYFSKELKGKLSNHIDKEEILGVFKIIWYNAKKLGINFLGAYAINKSSLFIIGFFLPLEEIASYGLMVQLGTIVTSIAQTLFVTYQPRFAHSRVINNKESFKDDMSVTMLFYWVITITGISFILLFSENVLLLIKSNVILPSTIVMFIYFTQIFLEGNHSNFASLIITDNKVPFVKPSIISGGIIMVLTVLSLRFIYTNILSVVLVAFFVQLSYNNWKWPKWVLDEFNISYIDLVNRGVRNITNKINIKI